MAVNTTPPPNIFQNGSIAAEKNQNNIEHRVGASALLFLTLFFSIII